MSFNLCAFLIISKQLVYMRFVFSDIVYAGLLCSANLYNFFRLFVCLLIGVFASVHRFCYCCWCRCCRCCAISIFHYHSCISLLHLVFIQSLKWAPQFKEQKISSSNSNNNSNNSNISLASHTCKRVCVSAHLKKYAHYHLHARTLR